MSQQPGWRLKPGEKRLGWLLVGAAILALLFAGCAGPTQETYIECVGKGDLHLALYAGSVDCPPPGLKLSIGRSAPVLGPAK